MRIGYEFDGAWNRGYEDSAACIAAFRRIADESNWLHGGPALEAQLSR